MNLVIVPYDDSYEDEIVPLVVQSYMFNNPFIKPLGLNKELLANEMRQTLRNKLYSHPQIFLAADDYSKGIKTLVGIFCWGDVEKFIPPQDGVERDFNQVPTKAQVRQYMRYKTMQEFLKKNDITKGKWAYGGNMALVPKYIGIKGLSNIMLSLSIEDIFSHGYINLCGHAINELAKNLFRRGISSNVPFQEVQVDVSDMFILESQTYPFKGMNLSQTLFSGYLDPVELQKGIENLRVRPKPKL